MRSRFAGFALVLVICAVIWLLIASFAFLWLAGLWDNPRIAWSARPWIWLTYARHGDGSFSELLYLIASAAVACAPFLLAVRVWGERRNPTRQVYGKTGWASSKQMKANNIVSGRRPF